VSSVPSTGDVGLERCEALRAHVLGEGGLAFIPLGLAILRHRGMVAWMEIERRAMAPATSSAQPAFANETIEVSPGGVRTELIQLLASTALLAAAGGQP
jgi:hypothetical protein